MMIPKLNLFYSRQQISAMLGGSIQAFLPMKSGQVTCGCFHLKEELNPGAPETVLFGCDRWQPDVEKSVKLVRAQGERGEAIPIFLFRESAKWEYAGDYRCTHLLRGENALQQKMREHPRRGVITGILYFEKVASNEKAAD